MDKQEFLKKMAELIVQYESTHGKYESTHGNNIIVGCYLELPYSADHDTPIFEFDGNKFVSCKHIKIRIEQGG